MHNMHPGAFAPPYEGNSRINDNEFISQKVLLDSFIYYVTRGYIYGLFMPEIWYIYHG